MGKYNRDLTVAVNLRINTILLEFLKAEAKKQNKTWSAYMREVLIQKMEEK